MNDQAIILAIIYIALFLGVWYPFGSWYNRRIIKKYFKIIKNVFKNSELKKIGAGGLLISGSKMNSFKIYGIIVTPISRENPINWIVSYLAKRRDIMVFKGNLNKAPESSIEIINLKIGASKSIMKTIPKSWFKNSINHFIIYSNQFTVVTNLTKISKTIIDDSIWRISINNNEPNITLILSLERITEDKLKNIINKIETLTKNVL
ncbi:MAG: hypothetical protein ACP5GU_05930 [Thermoprotei archaeon]|jgi:hypothetical protein